MKRVFGALLTITVLLITTNAFTGCGSSDGLDTLYIEGLLLQVVLTEDVKLITTEPITGTKVCALNYCTNTGPEGRFRIVGDENVEVGLTTNIIFYIEGATTTVTVDTPRLQPLPYLFEFRRSLKGEITYKALN